MSHPNAPRVHRPPAAWRIAAATTATLIALTAAHAAPAGAPVAPVPAAIGVSLDFLWSPNPDDDTQVFLHVSNMAYQPPREQVRAVYPRLSNPESDFPVLLFIATEARVGLGVVWNLKAKGLTWVQVMGRLNIPPERIFVELARDPGPPYGKAYGHWKKHPKERVVLSDDDVFYWVNIRTQAKYFGVDPGVVVQWRESGRTWKSVAASEFRTKKGKEKKKDVDKAGGADRDDDHHSHSKGKGKGRSR